ncbi:hypothetical protein E2C01_055020 [Portunus trituberculatus]|uniref:Uncharacterized protein n=1 Tax=Portunus trituberculatus TaxID=210409 RepID=A0A5B7GVH0_PORTR|nr:hypothetical protein [Portunus trituberculatus]
MSSSGDDDDCDQIESSQSLGTDIRSETLPICNFNRKLTRVNPPLRIKEFRMYVEQTACFSFKNKHAVTCWLVPPCSSPQASSLSSVFVI